VQEFKPDLVFLSETRQNKAVVERICNRVGFSNCLPVCVEGKGGGLALFVSDSVSLNLFSFGPHHIDTTVTDQDGIKARYTFVYGEPKPTCRPDFLKLLKRIRDRSQEPWFIVGDFNESMFQSEHWSATRRSEARMRDFRDTLEFCNLHDLGYVGCPWTFDNNQSGRKNVRVRLDRAVACPSWSQLYPQATVQHLVSSRSDHCPIVISLVSDLNRTSSQLPRYEAMWEIEASLTDCINEA
jgi:hypothetical protein